MNKVIIFVLLFTFILKVEGTSDNLQNGISISPEPNISSRPENTKNYSTNSPTITEIPRKTNVTSSTSTLPKSHSTSTCINSNGQEKRTEVTKSSTDNKGEDTLFELKTILTFLLGVIFSTIIFSTVLCCAMICSRCRTKDTSKDKDSVILETVKHECDQSDGQQAPLQAQSTITSAEYSGTEEELKILGKEQTKRAEEVSEVDYASINYSLLQKKNGDLKPQKMESDYAEIQIKKMSEGEVETLQDGGKQDEVTQHEVKQDGVDQDGVKQDGVDQGLEGGIASQKQVELDEVQV